MKLNSISVAVLSACVVLAACGGTPANAQPKNAAPAAKASAPTAVKTGDVPADVAKTITATLEKNYGDQGLKIHSVNSTPINGIYEIIASGKQVAYTDATGKYMFVGDLIETTEGRSLTEERKAELNAVDFNALPLDKAIKEVRGTGELKVAVFSDADCPFCRRLETEFAKMDNVTIYNFMMPIASLHPDAYRKTVQILCQPDPSKAWTEWMRQGKMPPKVAECQTSLDETLQLGEQFGFNGTPTLVFPNGKTQSGYVPMPQLEQVLQANQK
ncbi:DsbC family protein [Neisseriaceae bacterium B1]